MSAEPPSRRERVAYGLLRAYKLTLGPLMHTAGSTQCRYLPTCSEYAYGAIVKHGWFKGSWLAMKRLGRCHPFAEGGSDPVP